MSINTYICLHLRTQWDEYMTKFKVLLLFALILVVATVPFVKAETGTIRIGPEESQWPMMTESPADFEIWVQGAGDPTYEPNILLVMTEATYEGLGSVEVSWTGGGSTTFLKGVFTFADVLSDRVPDTGTTSGASYTVASLKTHLNYPEDEPIEGPIYWAMGPFVSEPLTTSHQAFTVTLTTTEDDPRMLVYALGKTQQSKVPELFNNKVPPTIPGFVVPELGTILLAAASFTALALYAIKRKK